MSEKRVKIKIDKEGNFDIKAVKGFVNGECHNVVEAIISGMNVTETDRKTYDDYQEEPNLLAHLK